VKYIGELYKISSCFDDFRSAGSLKTFGAKFENKFSNCIDAFKSASSLKAHGDKV